MKRNSVAAGWLLLAIVFAILFALGQVGQVLVRYPNFFVLGLLLVSFGMVMYFGDWRDVKAEDMEEN